MFNSVYKFDTLEKNKEALKQEPTTFSAFRFQAKKRRYHVLAEHYSFGFTAIKFCDVHHKASRNAYRQIFNDHDAFKVISTCVHIMFHLWRENPNINFAFYAVQRDIIDKVVMKKKKLTVENNAVFREQYIRSRFNIYQYAMLNLFPPNRFKQMWDWENCIYVLLNKMQQKPKTTLKSLGKFLAANHSIILNPVEQPKPKRKEKSQTATFG